MFLLMQSLPHAVAVGYSFIMYSSFYWVMCHAATRLLREKSGIEVLKDALSIHGLLRQEPSRRQHGQTAVLELLRNHDIQVLFVVRLQPERIKTDVARVVIVAQQPRLIVRRVRRIDPPDLRPPC